MYGNPLGWKISGVLAGLIIGILVSIHYQVNNTTTPTNFTLDPKSKVNIPLELPAAANTVVSMDSPGDAGPLYRQAINSYSANPTNKNTACIDPILRATSMRDMNLFITSPEDVVNYRLTKTPLEHLLGAAECVTNQGLRLWRSNPSEATRYFQAVYALGYKMFKERLCFREGYDSIGVMNQGLRGLAMIARNGNDSSREKFLTTLINDLTGLASNQIMSVNAVINKAIQPNSFGDIYHVAQKGPDRMWRTESLLAMGRYRYNAGTRADNRAAEKLLMEYSDDPDPAIRTAAKMGLKLSVEQYRDLAADPDKY